jgi:hypothetical protein
MPHTQINVPFLILDKTKVNLNIINISDFERMVSQEYQNQKKRKEAEIANLQKSLLRDSMRIAFFELG